MQKACDKAGAGVSGSPSGPGAAKVSSNNADACKVFNHVATICRLDTGMSRMAGGTHTDPHVWVCAACLPAPSRTQTRSARTHPRVQELGCDVSGTSDPLRCGGAVR